MPGYWFGKRVFVTGATGLVGSWLVKELVDSGAEVTCLVRDFVPKSFLKVSGYDQKVVMVHGALEDYWTLERSLNEYEIDSVFHLAAQTIVGTANRSPLPTFEANIRGTWNLLEACRVHGSRVKRIVIASSDKAYGDQPVLPYTETTPLQGKHPYDVSKSCTDLISQAYAHTYRQPLAIARCGNVFGGGDLNFNRLVPGTISGALKGEAPVIRSDGSYIRDYVYVRDVSEAYLTLAQALGEERCWGEAFNFSTDKPYTVLEMTAAILEAVGRPDLEPIVQNTASAEIKAQTLSSQKARDLLGWNATYGVELGLIETVMWYRELLGAKVC